MKEAGSRRRELRQEVIADVEHGKPSGRQRTGERDFGRKRHRRGTPGHGMFGPVLNGFGIRNVAAPAGRRLIARRRNKLFPARFPRSCSEPRLRLWTGDRAMAFRRRGVDPKWKFLKVGA